MVDVTLVTCRDLPEPDPDAAPLERALTAAGLSHRWAVWTDDAVDWRRSPVTVLRSTWDYYRDPAAFLAWAERASRVTALHNPLALIRYDSHKRYLLDLHARGVPTIPTALVPQGDRPSLADLCRERGWQRIVIKPAVSAGSWSTFVAATPAAGQADFERLRRERDVLVQPFMESVATTGERSVVVIDGAITHAVRKQPRFAGEDERVEGPIAIDADERALVERVLAIATEIATEPLLYARFDLIRDAAGAPLIAELEALEPSLFFALEPASLDRFVAALQRLVSLRRPRR